MADPRIVRFQEVRARIEEGPVAYCNPEVAHDDALWLLLQLDAANMTMVRLDALLKEAESG